MSAGQANKKEIHQKYSTANNLRKKKRKDKGRSSSCCHVFSSIQLALKRSKQCMSLQSLQLLLASNQDLLFKVEVLIMSEHQKPEPPQNLPPSSTSTSKSIPELGNNTATDFSGQPKVRYPNPPDLTNPDPATLRDQWRYAIRQYSRWYSHAWGTAILAGVSFFALGWIIKGSNPLPSFKSDPDKNDHPK